MFLILSGVCCVDAAAAAEERLFKEKLKTAFLIKIIDYIDFPEKIGDEFHVVTSCACADKCKSNWGKYFCEQSTEVLKGKRILCHNSGDESFDLSKVNLLILGGEDEEKLKVALSEAAKYSMLTIGEGEGFTKHGGMIAFYTYRNKLRFDVNLKAMAKANIKMRASLIRLARNVVR